MKWECYHTLIVNNLYYGTDEQLRYLAEIKTIQSKTRSVTHLRSRANPGAQIESHSEIARIILSLVSVLFMNHLLRQRCSTVRIFTKYMLTHARLTHQFATDAM
jgi:hypothetical protein